MKSQTSTEYLVLTAVVIILALIVIGILGGFSGSDTGERTAEIVLRTGDVAVLEYASNESGTAFTVQNLRDRPITVSEVQINGIICSSGNSSELNLRLGIGESRQVFCLGNYGSGSQFAFRYIDDRLGVEQTTPGFESDTPSGSQTPSAPLVTHEHTVLNFANGTQ
ncbi:MAG: hypothetical protein ACMXYA_00455, partial [Candidatus Woesearchaeota archaeon]